jgi:hypothetical protein
MTTASRQNGLVVLHVKDSINAALAGHDGCDYTSPPQPCEQALELVALLLGCPARPANDNDTWSTAIAGGRRSITLRAA